MQRFNKATAAAVSGAVTALLVAFFPDLGQETVAAVGVIVTTFLVWLVPNVESKPTTGGN